MSIHKDKVLADGKSLMDLLKNEKEKLEAVKTFLKYGKSSVTDCSGDQLMDKLVEK